MSHAWDSRRCWLGEHVLVVWVCIPKQLDTKQFFNVLKARFCLKNELLNLHSYTVFFFLQLNGTASVNFLNKHC